MVATKQARKSETAETRKRPDIEVNSEHELNEVLAQLSLYGFRREKLQSELKKKVAEVSKKLAEKFLVEYEGETYHIHDVIEALNEAGLQWAMAHRAELLEGLDKKSKKLPNGIVAWAIIPSSGGYRIKDGETEKGILDRLADRFGLVELILKLLRGLKLRGKGAKAVTLDRVIDLKPQLNLQSVKLHHERGELSDEDLEEIGVEVRQPEERCTLKPNDYTPD